MYYCTHYAYPAADHGFTGYRVLPQYSTGPMNILPANPSRPIDFVLSAAYAHPEMPDCQLAMTEAIQADAFPGQHPQWQ